MSKQEMVASPVPHTGELWLTRSFNIPADNRNPNALLRLKPTSDSGDAVGRDAAISLPHVVRFTSEFRARQLSQDGKLTAAPVRAGESCSFSLKSATRSGESCLQLMESSRLN